MKLTEKTKERILELQKLYPEKRSAIIPALHIAQEEVGFLPEEVQHEIAELFGIEATEVHALVTFYDMFHEHPVGKHELHVCKNISCMLRGSDDVTKAFCRHLNVEPKGMTEDGQFSLFESECLAACDRAPMCLIDKEVVGPLRPEDVPELLEKIRKGSRDGGT